MKNAIIYYYKLNPEKLYQKNNNYEFEINNQKYILTKYKRRIEELDSLYKLHLYIRMYRYYCHEIILNSENKILTYINNTPYILLKLIKIKEIITIKDILYLTNIKVDINNFREITRKNWSDLWSKKNDYLEYQVSQFGKQYPLIRESSDYYIGIVENCIQLLNQTNIWKTNYTISHDRIRNKEIQQDFYNPLNFILDNRTRDMSEYIKIKIYDDNDIYITDNIEQLINNNFLNEKEIQLLFIRIIYPSKYMDLCEKIIDNKKTENTLITLINKTQNYEANIKKIYKLLKKYVRLPEIEWLKK